MLSHGGADSADGVSKTGGHEEKDTTPLTLVSMSSSFSRADFDDTVLKGHFLDYFPINLKVK